MEQIKGTLYYNKSDRRYLKKKIEQIGDEMNLALIEPTSVTNPDIILSPGSRVIEANYIYISGFNRYYYIENYTFEYDRIIAHCKVDVLMSFGKEILDENIIMERSGSNYSLYMNDSEMKMYNYSSFQTIPLKPTGSMYFSDTTEQMVMVCSGNI
jgi:hypothetical protein